MSKTKPATTKRPSPPDRDGDSRPGGSLPGNKTVDAAKGPEADALEGAPPETRDAIEGRERPVSDDHAHEPAAGEGGTETAQAEAITIDPEVCGGEPCVRGLRIRVSDVLGFMDAGEDDASILAHHPDLTAADLDACRAWREAQQPAAAAIETFQTEGGEEALQTPVEWTRDDAYIHGALCMVSECWQFEDRLAPEVVVGWTDQQALDAETWAEAVLDTAHGVTPDVPDFLASFAADTEAAPTLAETEAAALEEADAERGEEDTFTPEEILAGQTDLVQEEGETAIAAAVAAPVIDDADPLVMIETRTAPVALRLGNLRRLVENRLFYKSEAGFSPNYHAPHVDEAEVRVWLDNGLARWDETAGRIGGIYVEPEASRVLRDQPQRVAA